MLRVPWFLLSCGDPRGSLGLCRGSQQVPGEFCLLLFLLLLIKTFPLTLSFWPFQTTDLRLKEALQKPEGDPEAKHTTCCLISPLCLSSGREDTQRVRLQFDCFYLCSRCLAHSSWQHLEYAMAAAHVWGSLSLTTVLLWGRSVSCLLNCVHSDSSA